MRSSKRHKVRIVKRRVISRTAALSPVIALGAAGITFLAWRTFRTQKPVEAYRRTLKDLILPYLCENGHEFNAPGAIGSPPCPICGAPSHHVTTYDCPIHGPQRVEIEFGLGPDGHEQVARIRLPSGPWVTPEQGLRCPKCQSPLTQHRSDDLSHLGEEEPRINSGEPPVRKEITLPGARPKKDSP